MRKKESSPEFLSIKKFSSLVNQTVRETKMSYIDTIVYICENNNLEVEDVKKFLDQTVLDNIEAEARSLNFLPKINTLGI